MDSCPCYSPPTLHVWLDSEKRFRDGWRDFLVFGRLNHLLIERIIQGRVAVTLPQTTALRFHISKVVVVGNSKLQHFLVKFISKVPSSLVLCTKHYCALNVK